MCCGLIQIFNFYRFFLEEREELFSPCNGGLIVTDDIMLGIEHAVGVE
jgi:hypothetical protein